MWGDCIRRNPARFWLGCVAGLMLSAGVALAAISWSQYSLPDFVPSLKLVETTIAPGDYLGFEQAASPSYRCVQETVRLIWRQKTPTTREIFPLLDINIVPQIWDGKSIVYLRIPENTAPGEWFYTRETAQWCSWWSLVLAKPRISRTPDIPFTVVSLPVKN
jgi:hypothetical protein